MKIISCHIENFGKLSDASFTFREGCNVILQENGWGKSTLAAFLKVMFYGFSNDKKRDEFENERKKYRPWQGGVYGGQLMFESDGKEYMILRTFGKKESEDAFMVKDKTTNLEAKRFSQKIGEELFQIDSDSFMRTIYVSQNDCETFVTDSINAKIGNLAQNTDDINNFETVNTRLSSELNKLSPARKTGSLSGFKDEIVGLEQSVQRGSQIDRAVKDILDLKEHKHKRLNEVNVQKANLQMISEKISLEKDIQANKLKYGDLCEDFQRRKIDQEMAAKPFPGSLPQMDELSGFIDLCANTSILQNTMETNTLSEAEMSNLHSLANTFSQKLPSDQELSHMEDMVRDLSARKVEIARKQMTTEESGRFSAYQGKFANGIPDQAQLDTISQIWNQRTEKKNTLSLSRVTLNTLKSVDEATRIQNSSGKSNNAGLILLLTGVILLVLGIAAFTFSMAAGLAGVIAGIGLAVVGLVYMINKRPAVSVPTENSEIGRLEQEIADNQAFIGQTEAKVQDFCYQYDIEYDENNLQNALYSLKSDVRDYVTLSEKKKSSESGNTEREYTEKCNLVCSFIQTYLPEVIDIQEDAFNKYLNVIHMNVGKYTTLLTKYNHYLEAKTGIEQKKVALEKYLQTLSIPMESNFILQLQSIKENLQEYRKAEKEFLQAKKAKDTFETNYPDMEKLRQYEMTTDLPSLEEINEKMRSLSEQSEELMNNIRDYDRQLESLEVDSDRVASDERDLALKQEEYDNLSAKYKRINLVQQYLRTAKENFTAKYMSPVLGSFEKYYDMLSNAEKSQYHVDANFNFKLEQYGDEHELKLLSTGYRDLTGICIRMALIETMYQNETPFILFDDPFVNMDKEKISGGMELLKEIGEKYQVIYFTCHESRKLGEQSEISVD
ncbi:MAG TPA: AAA family ATPase [Lachnospiraceae bacterium]|nr:AAA family ATPase [Lachnospiraceae bacterium]